MTTPLSFMCISGINFPTQSRKYLMTLAREVAVKRGVKFILVAGNMVDGRALEKELRSYTKNQIREVPPADREYLRLELEREFIDDVANGLNDFLPVIKGVNYHIGISPVFDRPIGIKILERLRATRKEDIRLIGEQHDGSYDPEPKVPVGLRNFEEIRMILPRRAPWYYRIITSFMQTLINRHFPRTFSSAPDFVVVGCTGTASYLPFYEGVPCMSAPALHKIVEQKSTENMVGCSVVDVISGGNGTRLVVGTYDFRPAIFREREFAIPSDVTVAERLVLESLISSDASFKIVCYRANSQRIKLGKKRELNNQKIQETLDLLVKKGLVHYSKQANRYSINEKLIQTINNISLGSLFDESREVRYTAVSCNHVGCLKTLYHTAVKYLPLRIAESDIFLENGDLTQGMAHNYEYNGDVIPVARGFDRQEIIAANLRARNIVDAFIQKYKLLANKTKISAKTILESCLVTYVFGSGNHDTWIYYNKHTLALELYERVLRSELFSRLSRVCKKYKLEIEPETLEVLVNSRVIRVSGESHMVTVNGFIMGVRHPYKGRTLSKSHRIQDAFDFLWRVFDQFSKRSAGNDKGFAILNVANFHECASVHLTKFGRTVFGVMTGAYVHDTSFERNMDKVVDYGSAHVKVITDKNGRLLYDEIEYDDFIHPEDEAIVLADKIRTKDVNTLCDFITEEIVDLPWRN